MKIFHTAITKYSHRYSDISALCNNEAIIVKHSHRYSGISAFFTNQAIIKYYKYSDKTSPSIYNSTAHQPS